MTDIAAANCNVAPYALIVGSCEEASQVVDKQVVMEIDVEDIPIVLMSVFIYIIPVGALIFICLWKCTALNRDP